MSKQAKMQDKVAKLLRQAEDVAGTPEEAIFQAKAFELIAKYGLDTATIEAAKQGLDVTELPNAIQWTVTLKGKYISQQALLLYGMLSALHCKAVLSKSTGVQVMHVFGVPRHIERVQFLWYILAPQMLRLVEKVRPAEEFVARTGYRYEYGVGYQRYTKSTSGQLRSYRRAWIAGFSQAVGDRLRAEENKALEGASSGALVLYKSDNERAAVALREAFPRTRRASGRTRYDSNGYAHGQRDGQRAQFNRALAGVR